MRVKLTSKSIDLRQPAVGTSRIGECKLWGELVWVKYNKLDCDLDFWAYKSPPDPLDQAQAELVIFENHTDLKT